MIVFVYDLVVRQKDFVRMESIRLARGVAQALATNSVSWLQSRDYSGLQEIVMSQKTYPNLEVAMVFSLDGKILAHTDSNKIGLFVGSTDHFDLFNTAMTDVLIKEGDQTISAIAVIEAKGAVIGKSWVILNQREMLSSLTNVARDGVVYTLLAILIGGLLAIVIVTAMTKRLKRLMDVAEAIKKGERKLRVRIKSPDELGQLGEAFDSMLDSLEQKEESLEIANRKWEQASRAKSEFLANMSHEIRTPINAMVGMADVLAETPLDHEQKKFIGIFQRAGENLINIINDILDFSKIEAGELRIAKNCFSIPELFEDVKKLYTAAATHKKLELNFIIDADVPRNLYGDINRLRQVLLNLVSNAIKFTDRGVIKVRVLKIAKLNSMWKLQFLVEDEGIGIAAEQQKKLFERFQQIDGSSSRRVGGTGLGLAISKRLVDLMGGNIHCESEFGKGSRFYFNVPLEEQSGFGVPCGPELPEGENSVVVASIPQIITAKTILIVDDAEDNRIMIRAFLKDQLVEISECVNGLEAVALFKENKYDVILLDLQMPVMDGYEAVQKMRVWEKENRRTKTIVIALSADTLPELIEKAVAAGCDDHISKPVRKKKLLSVLA
jgi:signal transduction histidine kinase/CheY-like chemotaxis protein